jgi:hypothetical protein
MIKTRHQPDHAYLLRCWQEGKTSHGDGIRWRYSLEGVFPKRSRQGFDDLETLVAFLQSELTSRREGTSEPSS